MKRRDARAREFAVEARERGEGKGPTEIIGYAAVFDQVAHGEVIRKGAFTKTLQEQRDIKAYWSHDSSMVLASRANGTLELDEDDHGLRVVIKPNLETTWGQDALASVARGDVNKMSFQFSPVNTTVEVIDGENVDVLREVRLYEVSPVARPWYDGTEAIARDDAETPAADTPETARSTTWQTRAAARAREIELLRLQR